VVRNLRAGAPPVVIYVTAYERHAVEAFETGAADYLLKPVRRERLEAALERAKTRLQSMAPPHAAAVAARTAMRRVVGRLGEDMHLLDPAEVIAFRADGELVHIITAQGRYLAEHSLRALEQKLPSPPFRRVHRAAIINTDHIRRISPLSSKRWLLKMTNGLEVIVSKRLAGAMREEMRW
jgi:DNA-binding LytR/AlgR family response regulator